MINYPNKIVKTNTNKCKVYANRGQTLENDLNLSNKYYIDRDIAFIYKKPTPIGIVEQVNEKITKAYFKEPSTTDYNGLYNGYYIDFEAKETTSDTSFPLNNIHNHQIKHINNIVNHQGIAFLIVRFSKLNETYLLFGKDFIDFLNINKRKSIPINYFKEKGFLIKPKLAPIIDYIEIIDKYGGLK